MHRAIPARHLIFGGSRQHVSWRSASDYLGVNLSRYRHDFRMHRRHILNGGSCHIGQTVMYPTRSVFRREIKSDKVRIVFACNAVVGCDEKSAVRVADPSQVLKGDRPLPFVFASPTWNRQPGVRNRADGNLAAIQVTDVALGVTEHEIIARVHPLAHRLVDLVCVLGEKHI